MSGIEGFITSLKLVDLGGRDAIEITVQIPQPKYPIYPDIPNQRYGRELTDADKTDLKNYEDEKIRFQAGIDNMYSLSLEDISIYPHRELPGASK